MRVAVIGCGSIGRRHVGNLCALGCDVFAFDLYEVGGAFPCWKLDDYTFDAVVIATPWDQHLSWAEWALERRLPMFIEKPLGSLEQLPRWREIAAMDLPVNQVGYMLRFHPRAREMHATIAPAQWVDCRVYTDMRTWPGKAYGPWLLECSHEIDLALWCGAGELSYVHPHRDTSAEIRFDRGCVRIDAQDDEYFREWSGCNAERVYEWSCDSPEELGTDMYRAETAHFLECVRENKPTSVPLADGLRVLEVCQQVEALCPSSR